MKKNKKKYLKIQITCGLIEMIKKILPACFLFLALASAAFASPLNYLQKTPAHLFVNNRVLAKVNDTPITVVDLMKKMDMAFYRQYPQYSSSIEARYQFYCMSWKLVMEELIEKELIIADAQEVKLEVSHGDIRQEMENLFGPNIIVSLDKAGLTYEEAWKIIKEDQLLKRMMMMRVNSLAIRSVTPQQIKAAYEEFAKSLDLQDAWRYEMIAIKGSGRKENETTATAAYALLTEEDTPPSRLVSELQSRQLLADNCSCHVSEEFIRTVKDISEKHAAVLKTLTPGSFSPPLPQESAANAPQQFRIFHLIEYIPGSPPPFHEVEMKLKNDLIGQRVEEEAALYIAKLYKKFDVQGGEKNPLYPKDFQPFVLK